MIIIPKRKWAFPLAYERSYNKTLRVYVARLTEAAEVETDRMQALMERQGVKFDSYEDDLDALLAKIGANVDRKVAEAALQRKVQQMYRSVNAFNEDEFKAIIHDAVGAEDFFINEKWQSLARSVWVQENLDYIRSIRRQFLDRIRQDMGEMILNAQGKQLRAAELSEMIQDIAHNARNRADLIARDQIGKLNGRLTQLRQQSAGIGRYEWSTSRDERVRASHAEREGKIFSWDNPPPDGHPGMPIRCRCVAIPVIDTETLGIARPVDVGGPVENGIIKKNNLSDVKDFSSLTTYLENTYDIHMDVKVTELDFASVKESITGIESVINEFPGIKNYLRTIEIDRTGVMSCTGETITFNPNTFSEREILEKAIQKEVEKGFWVKNTTAASLGAHEAGHAVEWLLLQSNPANEYEFMKTLAWRDCTEAKAIVSAACRNVKKTPYGKGKRNTDLVLAISRYADRSNSEALAEAFADVYANGENANPLSIEIKRLAHETLERYEKG